MIFFSTLVVTIKDFNAESRDKELREINVQQRDVGESKIGENMAKSVVFEKLYEVQKVQNNLETTKKDAADLNDIEVVTSDENIYYEL